MNKQIERRAERRERQRDEILDVALAFFARHGYARASMGDIAAQAGYSVGHIYNVVGKKDALFQAAMMREGAEFEAMIDGVIARYHGGRAAECIDGLVDGALVFFDAHRDYFQVYLNEAGGLRANVGRTFFGPVIELDARVMRKVKGQLALAVREGSVAALPASDVLIAVTELINGFIGAWAVGGYRGRISRKARIIKQLLWKGIQA